jgi:hypothetical protein
MQNNKSDDALSFERLQPSRRDQNTDSKSIFNSSHIIVLNTVKEVKDDEDDEEE